MTQLLKLKLFLILVLVSSIFLSCNSSHDETEQKSNGINSSSSYPYIDADTLPELTTEQQSAFDALNSIQVQGNICIQLFRVFITTVFLPTPVLLYHKRNC